MKRFSLPKQTAVSVRDIEAASLVLARRNGLFEDGVKQDRSCSAVKVAGGKTSNATTAGNPTSIKMRERSA